MTDIAMDEEKVAPHNIALEVAILGAILLHNSVFDDVGDYLKPEVFYETRHGKLFDIMRKLLELGQMVTPASLRHHLETDGENAIDSAYVQNIALNTPSLINAGQYARTLLDLYRKRQLANIGQAIHYRAFDKEVGEQHTSSAQIEMAEQELFNLAENQQIDTRTQSLAQSAEKALHSLQVARKRGGRLVGIDTGFTVLNETMGGLHRSDLIVLAGRPAMGKTAFATNIAFNAARKFRKYVAEDGEEITDGGKVLFFSLEMSSEQLANRILTQVAGIKGDKIRRNDLDDEEFQKYVEAFQDIRATPFYIDDTPGLSITALRQRARRAIRIHKGIDLIIVDYLQLLQAPFGSNNENRVQEISEITRGLKIIAKELNVPILALSQLSRAVESRDDKRPQLSDLRESGSIEQDADVVGFLYRHEYYLRPPMQKAGQDNAKFLKEEDDYNREKTEWENRAQLIIAKQRHGPIATLDLYFNKDLTHFSDLEKDY